MNYAAFERLAQDDWRRIPPEYKQGIDGLVVERDALPHPTLPEVYTLGECLTEEYPSDFGGPETIRSVVVLYWGSFVELSRRDPDFDWQDEVWETLTHELRHHLESLAAEDALDQVDYAADQNFRRERGEDFDPYFYRSGEPVEPGVWRVEREVFIEIGYDEGEEPPEWVEFVWHGERHRARRPDEAGDLCYLFIASGVDTGAALLWLVLVRRYGFWASLRRAFRRQAPEIVQAEAAAEPAARGDS